MFGNLLKLIPLNIILAAVLVAGMYFAVTGHFNQDAEIRKTYETTLAQKDTLIHNQQEQIAGLNIDKNNLLVSNTSLSDANDTLKKSIERVISETKQIIDADNTYNEKIAELEKVIADQVRQDRIRAIRNGTKADLLLNYINKDVECWIANFDKTNGMCVQGVWRTNE